MGGSRMDTVLERMIPVTILTVPGALVVWVLLAARRRRRCPAMTATFTAGIDTAILLCAGLVFALVTAPGGHTHTSTLHLVPGQDIADVLTQDDAVWQIAGNLVLLAPLAALVPIRVRALRSLPRLAFVMFAISVGIEALQYFLHADRVTATDDALLNTIGATVGAGLGRSLWRGLAVPIPRPRTAADMLTAQPTASAEH
ncbi:VanZ family protein [Amycolatopsis sp. K13G38]|uniref:VanZ family protein n=1 Tax=Amycolatopsis acididurans TaxID=2724524 RepID=A0ABX1JFH1_9PSEU|nr:VanZ family protein [Amycolatopsis acididurans]NKQ58543.1 VanZ family protein [Amycolatopsis acididurans]